MKERGVAKEDKRNSFLLWGRWNFQFWKMQFRGKGKSALCCGGRIWNWEESKIRKGKHINKQERYKKASVGQEK